MAKKKITQVTVQEMYNALGAEIKKGNGNKYLVAAGDNEGNSYHGVFFHITPMTKDNMELLGDSQIMDPDKLMIIG